MHSDRALERTLVVWVPIVVVLHVAGGPILGGAAWGVHLYTFFPTAVVVSAILALTTVLVLSRSPAAPLVRALNGLPDPAEWSAPRRVAGVALASLSAGALMWIARVGHTLLGDGNAVVVSLPGSEYLHPRSPLTQTVLRLAYAVASARAGTGASTDVVAQNAVAACSVAAGMLFVPVAWGVARELTHLAGSRHGGSAPPAAVTWLVAPTLLTQGYVQLFFGYVEHYTLYLLAVGVYLWAGLRFLRGRVPLIGPTLAAFLAFSFHFSGAVLFPSWLVLVWSGFSNPAARRAAIRDLGIGAAIVTAFALGMAWLGAGYELTSAFGTVFSQAVVEGGSNADYMWSVRHLRDFFNEQLLIGPLGLALLLPGSWVFMRSGGGSRVGAFLLLAAASYLGASWIASEPFLVLGYAREWDMLSPAGLVFTVAGLGLLFSTRQGWEGTTTALVWAVALSLFHTLPWIAVNASGIRGVERMKTLPLGEGRAETAVGTWYMRHGTDQEAIAWFQRALREYPRNVNAWDKLGLVYAGQNRMNEAADAYLRAVAIRPDKIAYRHNLVESLRQAGRFEESLPHIEWLCAQQPANLDCWLRWTSALEHAGRSQEVEGVLIRAYESLSNVQRQAPQDYFANFNLGVVLLALDRPADALKHFELAHRDNPRSDVALVNMGAALLRLGRHAEARPHLERAAARTADANVRARARALLEAAGAP